MLSSQDAVFVMSGDQLLELVRTPYELEDDFQEQLANHPQLLGGAQIPGISPRRWLLVDREVSVPDQEAGSSRWSLDHLFIDQDCMPTLVEVKRARDTRLRREVIGQMLDYAANGLRFWPADLLRGRWEGALLEGQDPDEVIQEFAGLVADEFWDRVAANLQEGKVRMLFVSDSIPTELQTVIEYLNEQMHGAEVFGVSIARYVGHDLSVLVPRVVGSSARAQQAKRSTAGKSYEEYLEEGGEQAREVERRFIELTKSNTFQIRRTPKALQLRTADGSRDVLQFYPGFQTIQLTLDPVRRRGFSELADEILDQARRIGGAGLTVKYPGIRVDDALSSWDEVVDMAARLAQISI